MQWPIVFPVVLIVGGLMLLVLLWRFVDARRESSSVALDDLASTLDRLRDRLNSGEEIPAGTAHRLRTALTSLSEALGQ